MDQKVNHQTTVKQQSNKMKTPTMTINMDAQLKMDLETVA